MLDKSNYIETHKIDKKTLNTGASILLTIDNQNLAPNSNKKLQML